MRQDADIPNGLAAVSEVPIAGWAQIATYCDFVEFSGGFDDHKSGTPGDYGFKVVTPSASDPAENLPVLLGREATCLINLVMRFKIVRFLAKRDRGQPSTDHL